MGRFGAPKDLAFDWQGLPPENWMAPADAVTPALVAPPKRRAIISLACSAAGWDAPRPDTSSSADHVSNVSRPDRQVVIVQAPGAEEPKSETSAALW
jgi:hypothetical protein